MYTCWTLRKEDKKYESSHKYDSCAPQSNNLVLTDGQYKYVCDSKIQQQKKKDAEQTFVSINISNADS